MSQNGSGGPAPLIDPSLLEHLTKEQRQEALAAAAAAKRAEERAEQRALERAIRLKEEQRQLERAAEQAAAKKLQQKQKLNGGIQANNGKVAFISKRNRGGKSNESVKQEAPAAKRTKETTAPSSHPQVRSAWNDSQKAAIEKTYLGKRAFQDKAEAEQLEEKRKQKRSQKKITFRFQWDNTDDTFDEQDDLYAGMVAHSTKRSKRKGRGVALEEMPSNVVSMDTVMRKPLEQMTKRDWRIFRENYDIVVKGGKAPPPLRSFQEAPSPDLPTIHPKILTAIQRTLGFKEPSPIQRQAIPIGIQRRDLIGIAETGSGKTAAFGIPLLHYILHLSQSTLNRVAEEGPLAIVMAPTRELALQIDVEFQKLLSFAPELISAAIVGGQSIQHQAQKLRKGVHVVVGTPGRLNDCLEMAYLVLNQCCYIVLDEADRMLDMGFAPQMEAILEAMGGLLKSETEAEAHKQELEDLKLASHSKYRVTALFSATMPPEVERIASQYLRHPAVISIGDPDSRKNARIEQRIVFLSSPKQKESALRDILTKSWSPNDKIIVFVNEKKYADGVGKIVERVGRRSVVLHGGKSQEQREENLELFRRGGVVLVATDVAGRGLDIPNVTHVINYDLPTRSIDNYNHRIGRTGRAGRQGLATSFLTDEDSGIMAALKQYLESTGNKVPERLARHPAANSVGGNIT